MQCALTCGFLFFSLVVCLILRLFVWWVGALVGLLVGLVGWLVGSLVDVQRVCLHLTCHMFM